MRINYRIAHISRNDVSGAPRFHIARIPIGQFAIWLGPIFVLLQPKPNRKRKRKR